MECFAPRLNAGGPFIMEINAKNVITIHDVFNRRCVGVFRPIEYGITDVARQPVV